VSIIHTELIEQIARKHGLPIRQVRDCINSYLALVRESVAPPRQEPLRNTGILSLDADIVLHGGCALVYGRDASGKSALLKAICINALKENQSVLFVDSDNKLACHDLRELEGIVLANAKQSEGLTEFIDSDLVDVAAVDTITSTMSARSLSSRLLMHSRYLICAAQMRANMHGPGYVAACSELLLSQSYLQIHLTSRERVSIEGEDVLRIQYQIDKYEPDHSREGRRGSFIIRNDRIDNLYTAYDILKSRGVVTTIGQNKYIGDTCIGKLGSIHERNDHAVGLMRCAWYELSGEVIDNPVWRR